MKLVHAVVLVVAVAASSVINALATGVATIWQQTHAGTSSNQAPLEGMAVDAAGNVIVAGTVGEPKQIFAAKYASETGALIWEMNPAPGPHANDFDIAEGVTLDSGGNAYVLTRSKYENLDHFCVFKFGAATGALIWVRRFELTIGTAEPGGDLAIDHAGNIAFVVNTNNSGPRWVVAKLNGADGATLLWQTTELPNSSATDVTVDSANNVIASGIISGPGYSYGVVRKYEAATGTQKWSRSVQPQGFNSNSHGSIAEVVVNAAGDIYVIGYYHTGTLRDEDAILEKLSGTDGSVVWSTEYNSTYNRDDRGSGLVLDAAGNPIVSGYSLTSIGTYDGFVAKCDGGTGAIVWGVATADTGEASEPRIALDGDGNVVAIHHVGYGVKLDSTNGALLVSAYFGAVKPNLTIAFDLSGHLVVAADSDIGTLISKFGLVADGVYSAQVILPGSPGPDNIGKLAFTLNELGEATGKLTFGKWSAPFAAHIAYGGRMAFGTDATPLVFEISVPGQPQMDLALTVTQFGGLSGVLTRHNTGGVEQAVIAGYLRPYGKRSPVPGWYLNQPTSHSRKTHGVYNLALLAKAQSTPADPATYPQGTGYAKLTLRRTGSATLVGKLADGTPFTAAGGLRGDGALAFYAGLYRSAGCLAGELHFEDLADSDVTATNLVWARPAIGRAPAIYPRGWQGGIQLDAIGTKWGRSADFGQGAFEPINGNASLVFENGLLDGTIVKAVAVNPINGSVKIPVASKGTALAVTRTSGIVRGSFRHSDGKPASYAGVLLNKGQTRGGFGYFLRKPAATSGMEGQSGSVTLDPSGP